MSAISDPLVADITLVTHDRLPLGAPDDVLLADALKDLGLRVRFAVWNDPKVDWSASPMTIVRSVWDYHRNHAKWLSWVDRAGAASRLMNADAILRWNSDKRYLRDLIAAALPCVPTVFVETAGGRSLAEIARARDWFDIVVKPAVGASSWGAARFPGQLIDKLGENHFATLLAQGAVLIQPYLAAIESSPERSLVFVGEDFAHAFTKPPFNRGSTGETAIKLHDPLPDEFALARAALDAVPEPTLYARVDMVRAECGPVLMELELIEPDLGLRLSSASLTLLTSACLSLLATNPTQAAHYLRGNGNSCSRQRDHMDGLRQYAGG